MAQVSSDDRTIAEHPPTAHLAHDMLIPLIDLDLLILACYPIEECHCCQVGSCAIMIAVNDADGCCSRLMLSLSGTYE
jgi:hypothetical protein